MKDSAPRVVLVTRPTELTRLVAAHGTLGQARFFLKSRGQDVAPLKAAHQQQDEALATVRRALPREWRTGHIDRAELSRFVFEPNDIVVAVGQDGLVANVAKYLTGQRVVGVNPDKERYEGVLVRFEPKVALDVLVQTLEGAMQIEERTMVEARTDDGQSLRALNEVFVGHRTHQSARYRIRVGEAEERHSSSGVIVSTGTGATGWTRSIHRQRKTDVVLPTPLSPDLTFFVREAWPSVHTGTDITEGRLAAGQELEVVSEMNDGGVVFGDGIEDDRIELRFGACLTVERAQHHLRLVV